MKLAAVLVSNDHETDSTLKRIDGYAVIDGSDLSSVYDSMKNRLPEYMLPAILFQVKAVPLTVNGKIDNKALVEESNIIARSDRMNAPVILEDTSDIDTGYVHELERAMIDIWSEILNRSVIKSDNFFNLGGNSLSAVKLTAKMKERNLQPMSYRDLYVHQTIEKIVPVLLGNS